MKKNLKDKTKIQFVVFFLLSQFLIVSCDGIQSRKDKKTITATGEGVATIFFADKGLAYQRALEQAFSDAVAKAAGQVLSSETKTYNSQFLSDEVSASTSGLIKTHKILKREVRQNGSIYYVKVVAEVYPLKIKMRFKDILRKIGNPKMMFMIQEKIYIKKPWSNNYLTQVLGPGETYSEIAIGKFLSQKGITFVSKSVVEEIARKNRKLIRKAIGGSYATALRLANKQADVIIIGKGESRDAGSLSNFGIAGGGGMYSAQASLNLKVIDAHNGRIIAQHSQNAANVHIQKNIAAQMALKKAAVDAVENLLKQIKQYYLTKPRENEFQVNLYGIAIGSKKSIALKSMLLALTRAKKINAIQGKGNYISWKVVYPGTAEGFMEDIALKQKHTGFKFVLQEYGLGSMSYKVSKRK